MLKSTKVKKSKNINKRIQSNKKSKKAKAHYRLSIQSADDVPLNKDLPVTLGHFYAFRGEINSRLTTQELSQRRFEKKINARFDSIEARFASVDAQFASIDARFASIDARFASIEARFASIDEKFVALEAKFEQRFLKIENEIASLNTKVDRMLTLIEEQNDRNKLVMDGLINLFNRQDSLEKRFDERFKVIEDAIKGMKVVGDSTPTC